MLIEKLGYRPDDRLLIINADDFGITHASNQAIMELFSCHGITSASIMMTCEAAAEAAAYCKVNPQINVGIHLTLTSSENSKYGPAFQTYPLRSLMTDEGHLPNRMKSIEEHADLEEVRLELRAQIQSAIDQGIDPTHVDSHAGCFMGFFKGRDYIDIVLDLCGEYKLPLLLPRNIVEQTRFGENHRHVYRERIHSADQRGIMLIDDLVMLPYSKGKDETEESFRLSVMDKPSRVSAGITQLVIHPAIANDECMTLTPHYEKRGMEYELFSDPQIRRFCEQENIHLISWREIRSLQRKGAKA